MTTSVALLVSSLGAQSARLLPEDLAWRRVSELSYDRAAFAIAEDPIRGRLVMFGGGRGLGVLPRIPLDGTWEWDGVRWRAKQPARRPQPRLGASMAFCPVRRTIVMFGGADAFDRLLEDAWEWDGQDWRRLDPAMGPTARIYHSMATDPMRQRIVLFGGYVDISQGRVVAADDTWEWDGTTWRAAATATRPAARAFASLAWEPTGSRLLLAGGVVGTSPVDPTMWEWDGVDWRRAGITSPLPRPLMCRTSRGFVLFGNSGLDSYFWEWDSGWTFRGMARQPEADLTRGRLVWDSARQEIVYVWLGLETWRWSNGVGWSLVDLRPDVVDASVWAWDGTREEYVALGWASGSLMWTYRPGEGFESKNVGVLPPVDDRYSKMVWHESSGNIVLYSGASFGETWLWDGASWTRDARASPGVYGVRAACYDSFRDEVIMFGSQGEHFRWQIGRGWVSAPASPRTDCAYAYDRERDRVVAFGGYLNGGSYSDETWEWDGLSWTRALPVRNPGARILGESVFVPELGGVVLVGGFAPGPAAVRSCWLWDGTRWTQLPEYQFNRPPGGVREIEAAVVDPSRKRLLAVPYSYGEPWELDYRSLRTPQHHPRPGEVLRADLSLPGTALGTPIVFALSGAEYPSTPLPASISDAAALPLAPDTLLTTSLAAGLWQRLWPTHRISLEVRLPRTRSLVDTEVFAAAMVLSPTGRISRTTNNVGFRIVP